MTNTGDMSPDWPFAPDDAPESRKDQSEKTDTDLSAGPWTDPDVARAKSDPWDDESSPDYVFRHGLLAAVRQAARRYAPGHSVHPETLGRLARTTVAYHHAPAQGLPKPELASLLLTALAENEAEIPDGDDVLQAPAGDRAAQARAAQKVGLFALLRHYERNNPDKPRIGRNQRLRDRVVALGQDPMLSTPFGDIARFDPSAAPPMIRAQFLGYFGPFGALPLNWTEEVTRWFDQGDEAFVAFADILTARFHELFFRAWSDARAITQFDHPADRFQSWVLASVGNGTQAMQNRDVLSDTTRASFAALASGHVRSPVRLRQMLSRLFSGRARIDVEEMVPSWLAFEPDACSRLGVQAGTLGSDMFLGTRMRSASERVRVHVLVADMEHYFDFLPGRQSHLQLRALVHWYLGLAFEIEVVLWVRQSQISTACLGETAQLGWMARIASKPDDSDSLVQAAAFILAPPGPQDYAKPPDTTGSNRAA